VIKPVDKTQSADITTATAGRIVGLYVRGYPIHEITQREGIDGGEIRKIISRERKRWRARTKKARNDLIAKECAKLDAVERAAWEGWDRSLKDEVQVVDEETDSPKGPTIKTGTKRINQAGSPAFLATITNTVRQRCELLGLTFEKVDEGKAADSPEVVDLLIETREEAEEFRAISLEDYKRARGQ
jgi:hypothetical protein